MQVNLNCNQPKPQFGMAFRRPSDSNELKALANMIMDNTNAKMQKIRTKGFKQFENEQELLVRFDISFNPNNNSLEVINNKTNKVIETFPHFANQTGLDIMGETQYLGKNFLTKILNPQKLLPKEFHLASEHAKRLEKDAIEKENIMNWLF